MLSLPTAAVNAGQEKSDFLRFFICITERLVKKT